jgi:molybdate-binding protein/DNA-binding XRE family transcriptional regulator
MKMSNAQQYPNRVKAYRRQHGWSQEDLAQCAGISRAAVSAMEIQRLVPSVATALALARVFGCKVEDLFTVDGSRATEESWAWMPTGEPCRFWRAGVNGGVIRYPVETTVAGMLPHDGIVQDGKTRLTREANPEQTLVLASCDPTAGLLASEYERATGFRMLPLLRSSGEALHLLHQGAVHVAGIHLAASANESGNARAAKQVLGSGYSLLRFATWDEGLAVDRSMPQSSLNAILRADLRWVGREQGSGARQCQDEVLGNRRQPRKQAKDHHGVAEAIRCGWADVGVCLRLVSEQAGLRFIHVRKEPYDLCFATSLEGDMRLRKLIEVLHSASMRRLFESLPGYEISQSIETCGV